MDPITDIFRTMHVTAFGQHRLEATAPWGLLQEKQTEEKVKVFVSFPALTASAREARLGDALG